MALLVVFGGLPGTGKTSVSRAVADALGATFLRLDSVEVAMQRGGIDLRDAPVGYAVAHAIAVDQLRAGRPVVVDAVNPVAIARAGWQQTAASCDAELRLVRVVLPDEAEHRRRVETRVADIEAHVLPTWPEVTAARHDPWVEPHLELDNSSSLAVAVATVLAWLESTSEPTSAPASPTERVARGMARLSVADAGEVFTLQLAAWVREGRECGTLEIPPLQESIDDVRAGLLDAGKRAWGLRENGRLIAMVRLSMLDATTAFVGRLGVVPDLIGTGLGAATLRFVEAQVPPGTTRIELVTGLGSVSNHVFYEHMGYELVSRDSDAGTVRFAKPLT